VHDDQVEYLRSTRLYAPETIRTVASQRVRTAVPKKRLLILAADHTARGVLNSGAATTAMANRVELLDRLVTALAMPGVDGVLASPEILEDLVLLGALNNKLVFASMNRGGLPGSVFEMDDRFTGATPQAIEEMGFDGGKMLLRINPHDPTTIDTLEACAQAVTGLARRQRIAMVEPFMNHFVNGKPQNDLSTEAVMRSVAIASALGETSAYTWLKIPVVEDMERVAECTTMPLVLLGGEQSADPDAMYERWRAALKLPGVRGLVVGRNLLYPADGDVTAAVATATSML